MSSGLEVAVLENDALTLACSLNDDIHHGPGQVVRPNHQVGERHSKRGVDPAQQAVAEIWLLPRLDGVDVSGPEDVSAGKSGREDRLFCLAFVASESHPTLTPRG